MPILAAAATAGLLLAQTPGSIRATPDDHRLLLTAGVGHGKTWDDEGSIGSGVLLGAGLEWELNGHWSIGGRIERLAHHRQTGGHLAFDGTTLFATAEVRYRMGRADVRPYLVTGYGLAHFQGRLSNRAAPETRDRQSTSGTVVGGGGVEITLGRRLLLVPEVRMQICQPSADFATWLAIRAGVSVGWRP